MILVDSNVLIYAINVSSPKHKRAQRFLQENVGQLSIAHQNIFESLRVLTHPKFVLPAKPSEAIEAIEAIVRACSVISPDYKTHYVALELVKKHSLVADQIFDAYLVATALTNSITIIATDNVKDFRKFSGIKIVNPFVQN